MMLSRAVFGRPPAVTVAGRRGMASMRTFNMVETACVPRNLCTAPRMAAQAGELQIFAKIVREILIRPIGVSSRRRMYTHSTFQRLTRRTSPEERRRGTDCRNAS